MTWGIFQSFVKYWGNYNTLSKTFNKKIFSSVFLIMKQSSLVIKGFFKELAKYPIKKYYSQPNTIQSSVGMIFKLSDNKKL